MRAFLLLFCSLTIALVQAQTNARLLRGSIVDKDTHRPLAFSNVGIYRDSVLVGGVSVDSVGRFRFDQLPIGRYTVKATFIGYIPCILSGVELSAGKETVVELALEESAQAMNEVVITAQRKSDALNEMASVSARLFSAEEAQRYAGSRQDAARMASNFAGVQGGDDSRNDIVVRGNSPLGVLWRIDEVDVPNPSHFNVPGTTGGPVSAINSKMFGNSDFFTGAFPAEYGNASSGVFDLKSRNGNNEKQEFTGQIGFLGLEMMAEGPLSKKPAAASYLLSYRYSTLSLFDKLNIKIGTDAVPHYQDAAFKIHVPLKHAGSLDFFGIGGKSQVNILVSEYTKPSADLYADQDRDQFFGSSLAVAGASWSHLFNDHTYGKLTLSSSGEEAHAYHRLVYRDTSFALDSLVDKMRYQFTTYKNSFNYYLNHKFSPKSTLKIGLTADLYTFHFADSIYHEDTFQWERRMTTDAASTLLVQPYVEWKYKFTDALVLNTGLHSQYLLLNGSFALEPRAGLHWSLSDKQALSLAYGLHSRMQPAYIYYFQTNTTEGPQQLNKNLGFTKAHHAVLQYDLNLSASTRIRTETYIQYLFNVPVETLSSSYSMLNEGSSYSRIFPAQLTNSGTGRNYGLELTVEKFFSKSFFFLFTGSLYDSKYKGSDGIARNTAFNGKYAANLLAGKELKLSKNSMLSLGGKLSYQGGKLYSPADPLASLARKEVVEVDSLRNSLRFPDYFRFDIKLGLKINSSHRLTHEIALDLVNVLDTKNVLSLSYAPDPRNPLADPLRRQYQLGRLPLFYYKLDF